MLPLVVTFLAAHYLCAKQILSIFWALWDRLQNIWWRTTLRKADLKAPWKKSLAITGEALRASPKDRLVVLETLSCS